MSATSTSGDDVIPDHVICHVMSGDLSQVSKSTRERGEEISSRSEEIREIDYW